MKRFKCLLLDANIVIELFSLEEVFHQFGFRRKLEYQFTREFRRRWSQEGFAESLHGKGCKE
jgi:hypothetical protein